MTERDRGPDGRSTDIASGAGVPPWLAASLNNCSRCGTGLVFGAVDGDHRDRLEALGHEAQGRCLGLVGGCER